MRVTVQPWHKAPSIRLLIPFIAGILLQWYVGLSLVYLLWICGASIITVIAYFFLPVALKYRWSPIHGFIVHLLLVTAAMILTWFNDIRHDSEWIGNYEKANWIQVKLEEPLIAKQNSYKALASVQFVIHNNTCKPVKGKILVYFKKDCPLPLPGYGSQIVLRNNIQEIRNSGNPGSFDFKQYCLFQGITHQVFLGKKDFILLEKTEKQFQNEFIFNCRDWVLATMRRFINGKKELGLAEALLIGYKDDLDKNLIQSYSNTGVVHVVAISGLHLGLIYALLLGLTKPLVRTKATRWLRLFLVILSIWWFSILAGAQPSVLRSAVMFSFLATAEVLSRRTSIYNTLALSAFVLLCYNPFWLWDVGFQLSYSAVLSIIVFFRPVYNWFYCKYKIFDFVWKLTAVTISAQLLTLPITIYYFHQLPTLFLLTNLVAVPLSSIILMGEIGLCVLFFLAPIASFTGLALKWMIWLMNSYIEKLDQLPFSRLSGLSINICQAILLTGFIIAFCTWLMENRKELLWVSLICFLFFVAIDSVARILVQQQKKLIVYNLPKLQAIDLAAGEDFSFTGSDELARSEMLLNFNLLPSRILKHFSHEHEQNRLKDFTFCNQKILIIDSTLKLKRVKQRDSIDILILSRNPRLYMNDLNRAFVIGQIVADGSVPAWKVKLWKRDCDSLGIAFYNTTEGGAFEREF